MRWYRRGLRDPDKLEDKADPSTRWRRPYMRVVVCLSIDQGGLLGGYSGVEAGVERGEDATTSPVGLSYPKAKHRLERGWTRRSTTMSQRRIYRS
ncbi:hypothetical protein BHE74_00025908 [Ensete ventricosum]|nr:hypothetical protein BHE74_00025908 [Ensete ventricosum]